MTDLQEILDFMIRWQLTLVTAESCTGGLVAARLADLPGSGQVLEGGFVCYAPRAKKACLHVNQEVIDRHGLTSEPVAREMALGALAISSAKVCVANTGLADAPRPAAAEVPPGTVCFGWAFRRPGGLDVHTETVRFLGGRNEVREQAALHGLQRIPQLYRALAARGADGTAR